MYSRTDKEVSKEAEHKSAESFGHKVSDIWEDMTCSLGRLDHTGQVLPGRQKSAGRYSSE